MLELSADSIGSEELQEDPVVGEGREKEAQYCEIYLQELNQVPIINIKEKFLGFLLAEEGGKGSILKYTRVLCYS